MATTANRAATPRQSEPNPNSAAWKCFPSPYVMHSEQTRSRSRSRSRSRGRQPKHAPNRSQGRDQWQADPSTHDVAVHQPRPRSRLQKRPSQRRVDNPTSVSATMPPPPSQVLGNSSNPPEITALPQPPDEVDEAIPVRNLSLRDNPTGLKEDRKRSKKVSLPELRPRPKTSPAENDSNITNSQAKRNSDGQGSSSSSNNTSSSSPPPRTPRYQPLAPNDPSPLNPLYHIPPSSFHDEGATQTAQMAGEQQRGDHATLPPGFRLGKTEHTEVEETIRPPVIHEALELQRTEIVQEEITKEIHIHHYYTYVQPIKAIEVLPARHFIIDPETGAKVEILPPQGWTVPSHIQPYKPDFSGIGTETRHYLVNDEHPNGVPEPAPSLPAKRPSQRGLSKKASVTGNWTPFPKTR